MTTVHRCVLLVATLATGLVLADRSAAQLSADSFRDESWTPLYREEEVEFSFIFYREGDSEHNGVVVRIDNRSLVPVSVRFTMVFRSDSTEVVADPYRGRLEPGEMMTGSSHDLWWIPFQDERQIREVGMRAMEVRRIGDERSEESGSTPPEP